MLGWIIGLTVTAVISIITVDLLRNDDIFDENMGEQIGTGGLSPYERIEALSCDTEVEFTEMDKDKADIAIREIHGLLGKNPIERLYRMDAKSRLKAAEELHMRLCTGLSLDIGLEMGESNNGCAGYYYNGKKVLWVDYRYLLSDKWEYIAEYLDTVIHEFRHAMQYCFIEDSTYNGASEVYRKRMTISLHPSVYVRFYESPELYYNQLCERDARAYAEMVLQQLKGAE